MPECFLQVYPILYNNAPSAAPTPAPGLLPIFGTLQNIPIIGTFLPVFGGQQPGQNPPNQGGILQGWPSLPNLPSLPTIPGLPNLGGILGGGQQPQQVGGLTCPMGQKQSCKCEPLISIKNMEEKSIDQNDITIVNREVTTNEIR